MLFSDSTGGIDRSGQLYARLRRARGAVARTRHRTTDVDPSAFIGPGCRIAPDLSAAEHVFIGPNCTIEAGVSIGRWTMLAASVAIVGADHAIDTVGVPMQFAGREPLPATSIGEDCWIGHGAKVMVGCTIGDGTIVAAGSVVTKDQPSGAIVAGVPARVIRDRFATKELLEEHLRLLSTWEFNGAYNAPRRSSDPGE